MQVELFGIYFHVFELPLVFLAIVLAGHQVISKGVVIRTFEKKRVILVITFLLLYIAAIFLSGIHALDRQLVIKAIFKWAEIFFLTILFFYYIDSWSRFRLIFFLLFAAVFSEIFIVYAKVSTGELGLFDYRIFPAYSSVFALAMIAPFIRSGHKSLIILLFMILFSIYFSLSRSAYLATFMVLLLNIRHIPVERRKPFIVGIAVFISIFLFTSGKQVLVARWQTFFSQELGSNIERFQLVRLGWQAFTHYPITGVGSLNFPIYTFRDGVPPGIGSTNLDTLGPHNTFLQVAAEEGIVGLITFTAVIWMVAKLLFTTRRYPVDRVAFVIGLQGLFIAMFFNLIFSFISAQYRLYLSLLFALTLALTRLVPQNPIFENEADP
ncbi:hypothetical protein GF406_18875 [candidate division KSB1 bacterium]|nr:hypothetical protein [candidate division KSB1 bacterium]